MPSVNGGRVTTDGTGKIGYSVDKSQTNPSSSSTSGIVSEALDDLSNLLGSHNGVTSVKGRNTGNGAKFFAGSNGKYDVTLDFKSLVAGSGVTLTEDATSIRIGFSGDDRKISFMNLYEAPSTIINAGILVGNSRGTLDFTSTPTMQGSVLTFNGAGFVWTMPKAGSVTSVGLYGDNAIKVDGAPVTSNGFFNLSLANTTVTPGVYTAATINVDAQGRIVAASSTPLGEINAAGNLGSGAHVYSAKNGATLNFKSLVASGLVTITETANEITIGATPSADSGVQSVALSVGPGLIGSGSPITDTGTLDIKLANSGVTPGTYNSVTVDRYGRVTAATIETPVGSGPGGETITARNLGLGDGLFYGKTNGELQFKSILGSGATKKQAVNAALSRLVRMHDQRAAIDWIAATDPIADLRDPDVRAAARR